MRKQEGKSRTQVDNVRDSPTFMLIRGERPPQNTFCRLARRSYQVLIVSTALYFTLNSIAMAELWPTLS